MAYDHGVPGDVSTDGGRSRGVGGDHIIISAKENKQRAATALNGVLRPESAAPGVSNRDRYLGVGRILQLHAAFERVSGGAGGPALLAQADAVAKAQAWDAWVEFEGGRFRRLRGIPGGLLPLARLERLSPRFSEWLDSPAAEADPGWDGGSR